MYKNPQPTVEPAGPVNAPSVGSSVSTGGLLSALARVPIASMQKMARKMIPAFSCFCSPFHYSTSLLQLIPAAHHGSGHRSIGSRKSKVCPLNRAAVAHPVKSMVTLADPVCPAPKVPTTSGNGVEIIEVHAAPATCTRVSMRIVAASDPAGPLSVRDRVQTRAFAGPVFAVIFPAMVVVKFVKFAVMVFAASLITVVEAFPGSVTGPLHPKNVLPGVGIACTNST